MHGARQREAEITKGLTDRADNVARHSSRDEVIAFTDKQLVIESFT